jgi:hypothetical protein
MFTQYASTTAQAQRGGGGGDCADGIFVVGYSAHKKEKLERRRVGIIKK